MSPTSLESKKKKKPSMAEKRKKRSKTPPPRPIHSVKCTPTESEPIAVVQETKQEREVVEEDEATKTKVRATALVDSQRKSVDTLKFVGDRVSTIENYKDLVFMPDSQNVIVVDGFLGSEDLVREMELECSSMLADGKLSLRSVGSMGEYTTEITGGEKYADCPRCVEFVVSLTRNMPPLLNEAASGSQDWLELDATASMSSVISSNRKARLATEQLINEALKTSTDDDQDEKSDDDDESKYVYANGGDDKDARKVTALYFLTPNGWDDSCGGGISIKNSGDEAKTFLPAKSDRLMLFRSDLCFHKFEESIGKEGLDVSSFLVLHLVRRNK